MATIDQLEAAERAFRELLTDADLPQPDEVEYAEASVWFRWREQKLAVEVDVSDAPRRQAWPPRAEAPARPERA